MNEDYNREFITAHEFQVKSFKTPALNTMMFLVFDQKRFTLFLCLKSVGSGRNDWFYDLFIIIFTITLMRVIFLLKAEHGKFYL